MATVVKIKQEWGRPILHIEAEGAIVNVREGLHDLDGKKVTSIEILPDTGEGWVIDGHINARVILNS